MTATQISRLLLLLSLSSQVYGWSQLQWSSALTLNEQRLSHCLQLTPLQRSQLSLQELQRLHQPHEQLLSQYLGKMSAHLQSLNFPSPALKPRQQFRYYCDAKALTLHTGSATAAAAYLPGEQQMVFGFQQIAAPSLESTTNILGQSSDDLAIALTYIGHELFHSVQQAAHSTANTEVLRQPNYMWISESTATLAGITLAEHLLGTNQARALALMENWLPLYDQPLHLPRAAKLHISDDVQLTHPELDLHSNQAPIAEQIDQFYARQRDHTRASYQRAHWFYHLDRYLSPGRSLAWLAQHNTIGRYQDGANGLDWLDSILREQKQQSLGEYYPQFVAKQLQSLQWFSTEAQQRGKQEHSLADNQGQVFITQHQVAPVATNPHLQRFNFSSSVPPQNTSSLWLLTQQLTGPVSPDLRLVVAQQVLPPDSPYFAWLPPAPSSIELFSRVTNVNQQRAANSREQAYQLRTEIQPVSALLPSCIQVNQPFQLELLADGHPLPEQPRQQLRLLPKPGRQLDNGELIATRTGKVSVYLRWQSQGRDYEKKVFELNVQSQACGIRMTTEDGSQMIYDQQRKLTEFVSGQDIMLLQEPYIYVKDPQEGWIRLDLTSFSRLWGAQKKKNKSFPPTLFKGFEIASPAAPTETGTGFNPFQTPLAFTEKFSWQRLTQLQRALNSSGAESQKLKKEGVKLQHQRCPEPGCASLKVSQQQDSMVLVYDQQRRLIRVETFERGKAAGTLRFEYGNYSSRHPLPQHFSSLGF